LGVHSGAYGKVLWAIGSHRFILIGGPKGKGKGQNEQKMEPAKKWVRETQLYSQEGRCGVRGSWERERQRKGTCIPKTLQRLFLNEPLKSIKQLSHREKTTGKREGQTGMGGTARWANPAEGRIRGGGGKKWSWTRGLFGVTSE